MKRRPTIARALLILPLLSGCNDSDSPAEDGEPQVPPLVAVAEQGDLNALEALLRNDPRPDVRNTCDWTPLMKAALNGHGQAVDQLLDADATVDAEDKGAGYPAQSMR